MAFYLVKFEDNFADEFDVYGFKLFTEKELADWNQFCEQVKEYFQNQKDVARNKLIVKGLQEYIGLGYSELYSLFRKGTLDYNQFNTLYHFTQNFNTAGKLEVYFGSNEALDYLSYDDWRDCFEVNIISEQEYYVISNNVGTSYGMVCSFNPNLERFNNNED